MIIIDCEQNTPEWDAIRLGLPTSSEFKKIITSTGAISKQRNKYLYKLAGEKLSGEKADGYYGPAMALGHERENEAREIYGLINDVQVRQIGFCFFDENKQFGSSTDGLVGDDGIFENKNALGHVQVERLEEGWSKADHYQQIQGELYVTGRKWCDLMSYSRGIKPIIIRFERDEKFISKLAEELQVFIEDLNELVTRLKS